MRDGGRGFPGESTRLVCRQRHRRVQRVLRAGMSSCVATWHCPRHGMTHDDIGRRHGAPILTTPRRRCSPMPSVPPCRAMWRRPQFHACDGFIRCGACRHHARQPPSQGASLLLATPSRAALLGLLAFGLAACCSPPHLHRPPPPVPFGHDGRHIIRMRMGIACRRCRIRSSGTRSRAAPTSSTCRFLPRMPRRNRPCLIRSSTTCWTHAWKTKGIHHPRRQRVTGTTRFDPAVA
jgi:hypothetical protein